MMNAWDRRTPPEMMHEMRHSGLIASRLVSPPYGTDESKNRDMVISRTDYLMPNSRICLPVPNGTGEDIFS
ncbi:hypothetical protein N7489_008365 [Penicillium chrysogenum]|uniref:uncharacterized protein n=1 Tax=Penicillium chrysogenum TaxID=5076 RepID=UPI0024DF2F20|nr:uncharacterized protein N7489_008365 [Penicillium chrysogenum]KAJ5227657.1 hypothetical protein N7489_008365 [Penicillium chrysogenum]